MGGKIGTRAKKGDEEKVAGKRERTPLAHRLRHVLDDRSCLYLDWIGDKIGYVSSLMKRTKAV